MLKIITRKKYKEIIKTLDDYLKGFYSMRNDRIKSENELQITRGIIAGLESQIASDKIIIKNLSDALEIIRKEYGSHSEVKDIRSDMWKMVRDNEKRLQDIFDNTVILVSKRNKKSNQGDQNATRN